MRTVLICRLVRLLPIGALVVGVAACGDDDGSGGDGASRVVVTTSVLGDVVRELVGDDVEVEVLMPPGADPHDFAPSSKQAAVLREAGLVVTNGLGFEVGLEDTIDAAADDGVTVVEVAELAPDHLLAGGEHAHEEGEAEDAEAEDETEHEADEDPHVLTDPARMAVATAALAEELAAEVPALDTDRFRARAAGYVEELERLDAEVEALLAAIPVERRLLVTNHDVLGYFADRYGFEVLGTVVPSLSTLAEPSAGDLQDLAVAIDEAGVPAIFVESSAPARLAEALAEEGAPVEVVELYAESLGEAGTGADTYVGMLRTNAERIAAALA
jgi:zinc/manganese transport system substrate-binding protein